MSASKLVMMRINIAGYAERPMTLFGAYDPNNDVLGIMKAAKEYEAADRPGFLRITNQTRDSGYDAVYTEEETRESIMAFFDMDNLGLLSLKGDAQRFNPANKIERDGMDESGLKFRFDESISNAQVAVLAACLYANRQRAITQAASFAEDMRILTI